MKLGLITDIHERVDLLRRALEACAAHGVDEVLCLGDLFRTGDAIRETVELLAARNIPGIWGNHDFHYCSHPSTRAYPRRERYAGPVLDYLATFRPFLERDDCHFSHVEPWLDLNDAAGLWYLGGLPDDAEKAGRSFDACTHRVLFTGHHHRWLAATRAGPLSWSGAEPIRLQPPERYLIVVKAVCEGACAVYDTDSAELVPVALR